jgi:hypothetical protein
MVGFGLEYPELLGFSRDDGLLLWSTGGGYSAMRMMTPGGDRLNSVVMTMQNTVVVIVGSSFFLQTHRACSILPGQRV